MSRALPSLNALKAFEAAARHESLTLAASELNVSHAAISRHVRTLESSLRVALFDRSGRGVTLTEDGRALAAALTSAFDAIANATAPYARTVRRRQRLTITSDVAFAAYWLVPRLGRFTSEHPEIELVVDPSHRLVDLARESVDLGIRFGRGGWRNLHSEKLVDSELTIMCSPSLRQLKALATPADLDGALLLQEQDRGMWPAWLAAAGVNLKPSGPTLLADLTMTAAEAGQGFALADMLLAADALAARRLVAPFKISIKSYAYYLVRPVDGSVSKAAANFATWLNSEIAKTKSSMRQPRSAAKPSRK